MKIPRFQHGGVPGAEQQSVGAIVSAGRAKMGAINTLTNVVDKFGSQILKAETEAEYQRVKDSVQADTDQLWNDLQAEPTYDNNKNPTHNTLRKRFDEGYKKIVDKYQGNLQFHPNKANLSNAAADIGLAYGRSVDAEVRKRQVDNARGQVFSTISNVRYDDPNSIAEARDAVEAAGLTGTLSESEVLKAEQEIWGSEQDNIIRSGFQAARESGSAAEYADKIEYPPEFDQATRDKYDNYMRTYIDRDAAEAVRKENKDRQEADAAQRVILKEASRGMKMLMSGESMSDELLSAINENAANLTESDDIEQMRLAQDVYNNIQELMSMTQDERNMALSKTFSKTDDYHGWEVNKSTKQAYAAIERAVSSDPHQAWVIYGGGTSVSVSKDGLADSLAQIKENHTNVEAWLGKPTVPMSKAQASALIQMGPSVTNDILMAYDQADAEQVFTMLYKEDAYEMAVVGAMTMQDGGEERYKTYMLGAEILSDNPNYKLTKAKQSQFGDTTGSLFHSYTNKLFAGDAAFTKGLYDATAKVYAYLSEKAGVQAGELDANVYQEAMSIVVGDIIEHKDVPLLLPRGKDEEWLKGALASLDLHDIDSMGGFQSATGYEEGTADYIKQQAAGTSTFVSPESMLVKLNSGEATLIQEDEFGHYKVMVDGRLVANKLGGEFILNLTGK